jgi:transcription initiation factor TFIID subunit 2
MAAKLESGKYKNKSDVEADFRLMVRNARTYNLPESLVYNKANLLESYFDTCGLLYVDSDLCLILQ